MAVKKITKRVISSFSKPQEEIRPKDDQPLVEKGVPEDATTRVARSKKGCLFCQNNLQPSYTDLANLRRFLTDRAKIIGKERSGACSKHQRRLAKNIKYARHLALLPFVPKV